MKQTIRLKESELRRMIAESVKGMLNELDPRTYASYAQKRQQQAQQMPKGSFEQAKLMDKASTGQLAARDAWNKQYGYDKTQYGDDYAGTYKHQQLAMAGNDYNVTNHNINVKTRGSHGDTNSYITNNYNPYTDTTTSNLTNKDAIDNRTLSDNTMQVQGNLGINKKAANVARQMAQGNGNYIKGKGWQDESINRKIDRIVSECLKRNFR